MKLNYPIKYHYKDYPRHGYDYSAGAIYKSFQGDIVVVHVDNTVSTCWNEQDVIRFIKEGAWIVESSGSLVTAPTEPSFTITLATYSDRLKRLAGASKAAVEAVEHLEAVIKSLEE